MLTYDDWPPRKKRADGNGNWTGGFERTPVRGPGVKTSAMERAFASRQNSNAASSASNSIMAVSILFDLRSLSAGSKSWKT